MKQNVNKAMRADETSHRTQHAHKSLVFSFIHLIFIQVVLNFQNALHQISSWISANLSIIFNSSKLNFFKLNFPNSK